MIAFLPASSWMVSIASRRRDRPGVFESRFAGVGDVVGPGCFFQDVLDGVRPSGLGSTPR